MRPELETYQLIDHFLQGKLTGEDLASFQAKMLNDASFAEEVEYQKMVNTVVSGASFDDLRTAMTTDIAAIDKGSQLRKWGIVSASVLVLAGTAFYFMFQKETVTEKAPYEQTQQIIASPSSEEQSTSPIQEATNKSAAEKTSVTETPQQNISTNTVSVLSADTLSAHHPILYTETQQPKQEAIKQLPLIEEKKNPCEHVSIKAQAETQATCRGEYKGSILVDIHSISGGTQPYTISKDGEKGHYFGDLKAGNYSILITDALGCKQSIRAEVKEDVCKLNSFSIMPDAGETWKFTGKENEPYTLIIVNRAGQQVYKTSVSHGIAEWSGMGQQGEYVEAGLYIYIVEYTNGTKENGRITITR